ncbi:hypothetical protein CspeluHIS016_0603110 [Cutaneotrichosporon spelunceum]|uniref:Uncharacterized protein n=1 Tax=Cutaneotrichosporon spelunceum TaxID=1672016 RepID=A0AAD3YEC8_9TREE|nr:hypothetical protein CspeluHIS016_0603110 [Cutaneotrichosporon spelunceum]
MTLKVTFITRRLPYDCCETLCFDNRRPGKVGTKLPRTTEQAARRESSSRKPNLTRKKNQVGKTGKNCQHRSIAVPKA